MNPYIIRVCKGGFQKGRAEGVRGELKQVKPRGKLDFRNFEELWVILSSAGLESKYFESAELKKDIKEKRTAFRMDFQWPLIFCINEGASDPNRICSERGKLVDISCGGMKIETGREITIKEAFQVYIPMEKMPVSFLFPVKVKWNWNNLAKKTHLVGLQLISSAEKNGS